MQVTIDDYKINYDIAGEGEKNLVILQGWGTTMAVYASMVDALKDKYKVITLDLPGFGTSTEPREAWSVEDYVCFLLKFLDALQIKKCSLIGHSYGGRMIIRLASREACPIEIEKIVLVDSAGILPQKTPAQKRSIRRYKILKRLASLKISTLLFGSLIEEWKNSQGSADYRAASPIMRQCLVKAVNEDLTSLLPSIKQDTLLIWGDNDTATPISDGRKMDELIPNSGLAVIKGAGHYSFLEQPVLFRNIINAFL